MATNNIYDRLTEKEYEEYKYACDKVTSARFKYGEPSQNDMQKIINKAIEENRVYETEDRAELFKYITTMRYTAHMLGHYDGRGVDFEGTSHEEKKICVKNMYFYIVETGEVIYLLNGHCWFNSELSRWDVLKYFHQYGRNRRKQVVYMTHLKGLKYAEAYKKNFGPDKTKYQLVTSNKKTRAGYVHRKLRSGGRNYDYEYVIEHLYEF